MKLIVPFILFSLTCFAQSADERANQLKKFHEFRRKMLERVFKDFDDDDFMKNDDFFADPFSQIDKMFKNIPNFKSGNEALRYEWTEDVKGRQLTIVPAKKDTPFDLDVNDGMIKISGRIIHKTPQGSSVSSFSNSFSIPEDVDGDKVQISNNSEGHVVLKFPYRKGMKPRLDNFQPKSSDSANDSNVKKLKLRPKTQMIPGEVSL